MKTKKTLNASIPTSPQTRRNLNNQDNLSAGLSDAQLNYLNGAACREVGQASSTFWWDMEDWLTPRSKRAANYPMACHYRYELAPYILQQVTLTSKKWKIAYDPIHRNAVQIILKNVQLVNVSGKPAEKNPKISVHHIHILVSFSWLNRVKPNPDGSLTVHGILHEYVSSKGVRNIGVWPVLVIPQANETDLSHDLTANLSTVDNQPAAMTVHPQNPHALTDSKIPKEN